MHRHTCGCRTYRPTATRTAWRSIPSATTSSCRCPRAATTARPRRRMVAWACTRRSDELSGRSNRESGSPRRAPGFARAAALADQRFLVAHHLPLAAMPGPQLADEHPAIAQRRGARELHGALVGYESVIGPQRLYLEELQLVTRVHAVLDLAEHVQPRALALAVGFHRLEVVGEELRVAGPVLSLERFPRRAHLRFEQFRDRGWCRGTLRRRGGGGGALRRGGLLRQSKV